MSTWYSPQKARELAEKADGSHGSAEEREAACVDFERYHSVERMIRLAGEVELLRQLVEQARRIRYSPEVGYVEVRHVFEAIQATESFLPGLSTSETVFGAAL